MNTYNRTSCIFLLAIVLTAILSSCSTDDIMVNNEEPIIFDSVPKYNWNLETFSGRHFSELYIVDTSNIYIATRPNNLRYNGNTFEIINFGFPFNSSHVGSYDNVNIYFGGRYPGSPAYNKAILIKYTNGNVETYEIPYDSTVSIYSFLFEGSNQFWFSTSEGLNVYYFDNGNYKEYTLSERARGGKFYKDPFNNLYLFRSRLGTSGFENILDCYKYNSSMDTFELISSDRMHQEESTDLSSNLIKCGSDLISIGYHSLSYFNGSGWTKYLDTRIPNTPYYFYLGNGLIAGHSRDSFFMYDYYGANPFGKSGIFTYTPNKWNFEMWISEFTVGSLADIADFKVFGDRAYAIFNASSTGLFLSGKPK